MTKLVRLPFAGLIVLVAWIDFGSTHSQASFSVSSLAYHVFFLGLVVFRARLTRQQDSYLVDDFNYLNGSFSFFIGYRKNKTENFLFAASQPCPALSVYSLILLTNLKIG